MVMMYYSVERSCGGPMVAQAREEAVRVQHSPSRTLVPIVQLFQQCTVSQIATPTRDAERRCSTVACGYRKTLEAYTIRIRAYVIPPKVTDQ